MSTNKVPCCDTVEIIECNKIENPSSMDNSCGRKEKEITEGEVHISVTQGSFNATVTRGPPDDMKSSIELGEERIKLTLKEVACAEKAIYDSKAVLERKSKMLDDSKEKLQQFLLLGSDDTLHRTILEDSVFYMEESVSLHNEKLQLNKELFTLANKDLKSAYAMLTRSKAEMKSKMLDDSKEKLQQFPLLGSDDNLHDRMQEVEIFFMKKLVSVQNERLQLNKKLFTLANERVKSGYAVLTETESKDLDNMKRIIREFDEKSSLRRVDA